MNGGWINGWRIDGNIWMKDGRKIDRIWIWRMDE
jgi:hypothetical protein